MAELLKTKLYKHQQEARELGISLNNSALLMEPGTGKTITALSVIGERFAAGKVKKVLVIAPLSVLSSWEQEIASHCNYPVNVVNLHDTTRAEKAKALKELKPSKSLQLVVLNYESARISIDLLLKWKPEMVVLDESQKIKNPRAKTSRALHKLGDKSKFKMILTGTPVTQSPLDVWSQYRFLEPEIFGKRFPAFRDKYARMGGYFNRQIVGYRNLKGLARRAHSIAYRVTKEEALDLPPTIDQLVTVRLAEDARKYYDSMEKDLVVSLSEDHEISAPIVLTKLLRLQQITGGFLPPLEEGDEPVAFKSNKLSAVREVLEELAPEKKVVIFARFRPEVKAIAELAREMGRRAVTLVGGTKDRGKVISKFQNNPKVTVFVAQIQTGGVGITLTAADTVIFYSTSHSFGDYEQARARSHRIGQKNSVRYIHLVTLGTVDEDILESVLEKSTTATYVVDKLRRRNNMSTTTDKSAELQEKLKALKAEIEATPEVSDDDVVVKSELPPAETQPRERKAKTDKPAKEKKPRLDNPENGEVITVKELATSVGKEAKDVRKMLRKHPELNKAGGRWEWVKDSEDHKAVLALFGK